jgi:hypothetical protein
VGGLSYGWASMFLSLLASNCCILQLLLNLFSISCAGFSVLNKIAPYTRALALVGIGEMEIKLHQQQPPFLRKFDPFLLLLRI